MSGQQWFLKESYNLGIGKTFHLTENGLTIGRDPTSDVVVHSKSVDSKHAVIEWDRFRQQFSIRDLNTVNGTYVNQFPLRGTIKLLEQRDSIRFGYCTDQVFRIDLTVSPTVSTISTQTSHSVIAVPSIATTTIQYVPSVIVPHTTSTVNTASITQAVIPQVISVVSLPPEAHSVIGIDKTVQVEKEEEREERGTSSHKGSRSLSGGSPLYGYPSWWGEEEESRERKSNKGTSREKEDESFRPRSQNLLSPVPMTRTRHRSVSDDERMTQLKLDDQKRASSVDRELANTSFTVEFDTPKRSKPNIGRSSSLRLRPTSYAGGEELKDSRDIRQSMTPPTSPQHRTIKKRASSVYKPLTGKTPPTSVKSSLTNVKTPPTGKTPPITGKTPPTSAAEKEKHFTRGVRSATVVVRREDRKEDNRLKSNVESDKSSKRATKGTIKKDERTVKKYGIITKKKKTEESPLPSPPPSSSTATNSKRDATYVVAGESDDKLDETTLIFTPAASTSNIINSNSCSSVHSTPVSDSTNSSRPTSAARKQWNDNEVPHGLILSSIEARLKRLADAANITATSVKQFIEQSKEGNNAIFNCSQELESHMDLPQWKVVSKEYESICEYITASEKSLKAIHESLGQFVAAANNNEKEEYTDTEKVDIIIQSDSLEDSQTTTEDSSNNCSSNPMLLVTAAAGSNDDLSSSQFDDSELDRTDSQLYYSMSSETEDN